MLLAVALAALLCLSFADAIIPKARRLLPRTSLLEDRASTAPNTSVIYYFDQLIDHNDRSLGTFQQRYWSDWTYYKPGGPIVLTMPGEDNAEGYTVYLTNATISGMIAQQQCGATVLLEHRFFGYSNPYSNLTSQSLEVLTVQQAIDDLAYFAQNVNLPMPGGDMVKPDTTPWILVGGSYGGALTSWTMVDKPGVFYAGYASSAIVESITDFYRYYTPILEYMPQNCSSDVQAVIVYLDEIYAKNDTAAMQRMKESFGLGNLSHIDDFAYTLKLNIQDWNALTPSSGSNAMFFRFCDALEVKDNVSASAAGWGLEHTINAWASFWNNTYYAYECGNSDAETCLGSYDTSLPFYSDFTVNNQGRSWLWLTCNQLGGIQNGSPKGQPEGLVSQILQPIYQERICANIFPDKFSSPTPPATTELNRKYGGWNLTVDRLFFANARRDPWRESTISASGIDKASTPMQPIYVSNGYHTSDLLAKYGLIDETILAVQMAGLAHMKAWLE